MDEFASHRRDLLLLFLAIAVFFAIGLGARTYLTPSEARYIEIPRQMLATGDFLTPRINGVPYFEKPPLFYWMQAGVMSVFGMSEFSGRLAEMLIVTLTCLMAYGLGRALFGRMAGIFSALTLATCIMGYGLSRVAVLDAPITLFITATLGSFMAAQLSDKKNRWYYAMYVFAALAMMTKGLIGIAIPGIVIGSWIALTRKWHILKEARLFSGTLLFLAIAAPWHVLMQRAHPEFLDFYFIHEHFTRYLTDEHKRDQPWWFFIAVTLGGLLPWVIFLPSILRQKSWKANPLTLFLWLWILLPLIFFSVSHSKLTSYIFPIFPPLCLLLGKHLAEIWPFQKRLIVALAAIFATLEIAANYIEPHYDHTSIKPLAATIQPKPDDMVVAYESYWQDLPVYLNRNVTVAGYMGELGFGAAHDPATQSWMIDEAEFWRRCAQESHAVYVFMRLETFSDMAEHRSCDLKVLGEYGNTVLLQKEKP